MYSAVIRLTSAIRLIFQNPFYLLIFFMRVTMSANFSITPAAFIPLSFRCPPEKSASSGDRYHLVGSLFQFANPTP